MRRHLIATALILGMFAAGIALSPRADAGQVERPTREVSALRVTYVEQMSSGKAWVELNSGAAYRLRPCLLEDSTDCYWNAGTAGNGHGHSFVRVRVRGADCTLYLTRRDARRWNVCEVEE